MIKSNGFTNLRNRFQILLRKSKIAFYQKFIESNSQSTAKFGTAITPYTSPNKKVSISLSDFNSLKPNVTAQDVAKLFGNFFCSILVNLIFLSTSTCVDYTNRLFISSKNLSSYKLNSMLIKSSFKFLPVDQLTVQGILSKIGENESPGFSAVESIIFRHCASELTPSITHLFNLCIKTNIIPDEWKIAFLSPIYKGKGAKSSPDSYRPISVLSPIANCFERIMAEQMTAYLSSNSILQDAQNGFRANRFCELTLLSMIEKWKSALDISENFIAVFLDLSKAFDSSFTTTIFHQTVSI